MEKKTFNNQNHVMATTRLFVEKQLETSRPYSEKVRTLEAVSLFQKARLDFDFRVLNLKFKQPQVRYTPGFTKY